LITGASVGLLSGGKPSGLVPLCLAAVALFWLRTPVESWTGTSPIHVRDGRERVLVGRAIAGLAAVAALALLWLFWGGRNLPILWIGAAAAVAFLAQAALRRMRRDARTAAQMIGAAGLTSTAPAAYYVVTAHLNSEAFALWAANLLFAINQIHFVQLRLRAAHPKSRREKLAAGKGFLAGQITMLAALTLACALRVFSVYAALAFVPILARGFAWFLAKPRPLAIYALGKSELAYASAFGVLLVLAFALP